eukprot:TRINITY_DN7533_c1_g1_i4.p2 TRINITY_DN7533_c1_g1~~TRINITY_DN7533_c1_g1_i4.p2  ORF type:complete len:193 (+),score=18.81 TRINITY_DN7533_c1_g1_i4:459-1037(+)
MFQNNHHKTNQFISSYFSYYLRQLFSLKFREILLKQNRYKRKYRATDQNKHSSDVIQIGPTSQSAQRATSFHQQQQLRLHPDCRTHHKRAERNVRYGTAQVYKPARKSRNHSQQQQKIQKLILLVLNILSKSSDFLGDDAGQRVAQQNSGKQEAQGAASCHQKGYQRQSSYDREQEKLMTEVYHRKLIYKLN